MMSPASHDNSAPASCAVPKEAVVALERSSDVHNVNNVDKNVNNELVLCIMSVDHLISSHASWRLSMSAVCDSS